MSLLALEVFDHIPGWLAGAAKSVAGLFWEEPTYAQVDLIEAILYGWVFVIPTLVFITWLGTRRLQRVPTGLQNFVESVVELLEGFTKSIIGEPFYKRFVPFIGCAFIYILMLNFAGLLPGMAAATSIMSTTVALALCTFFMTHYAGFRFAGGGYLKHFAGEPLWLAPLMVPLHIVSELARPLSLSLRLFGNIGGEEKAIAIFVSLGLVTGAFLPVQAPLLVIGMLNGFIQALVFCLLSSFYISAALPHEHHDHEHVEEGETHTFPPPRPAAG